MNSIELICRLCGNQSKSDETVKIFNGNSNLVYLIRTRLQIAVNPEDFFSHVVCFSCIDFLEQIHTFTKKCQRTQMQLFEFKIEDFENFSDNETVEREEFISSIPSKRPRISITAENCDNIIIPDNFDDNQIDLSPKKVPLSRVTDFFRQKVRFGRSNSNSMLKKEISQKCLRKDEVLVHVSKVNNDPDFSTLRSSGDLDDEPDAKYKPHNRIPPKVNDDDVKCPFCSWFIVKTEANEHIHNHTNDDEFREIVLGNENNDKTKYITKTCSECEAQFYNLLSYMEHVNNHKKYRPIICHICQRTFPSRQRLKGHMSATHLERKWNCDECSYRAKHEPDLKKHKMGKHGKERMMCPICGKLIAAFQQNLTKHIETHSEIPKYVCNLCPSAFKTRASLAKHRENRHFPKPTMCYLCGTLCASQCKHKKHLVKCKKRNQITVDVE